METGGLFNAALIIATFLCSLVAGFLFAFAVVAMPGLQNLSDREFLRAFQVMDRVIQNKHPLFMLVWVGSIVIVIAAAVLGVGQLDGTDRLLLIIATLLYLLGVQLPTIIVNIPLNNRLQAVDVDTLEEHEQKAVRKNFEPRWNRWNSFRSVLSILSSALLILLAFKL